MNVGVDGLDPRPHLAGLAVNGDVNAGWLKTCTKLPSASFNLITAEPCPTRH
jgi:hypothetical protein